MNKIENSIIDIDLDNCTLCKACLNDCVFQLFNIESEKLHIDKEFEERCILCGHCVAVCPVNVIKLKGYSHDFKQNAPPKRNLPDYKSLYNLALARRSIRQYKDKPVEKELIHKILELAQYSPTGRNTQNLFYTIIQDKQIVSKISNHITSKVKRRTEALEDFSEREHLKSLLPKEEFDLEIENLARNKRLLTIIEGGIDFWCWDGELILIHAEGGSPTNSALAAAHIMLAAETLGLGTCSLGFLTYFINQSESIKEMIDLPKNNKVGYALAIGYPKVKYKRIPMRKPLKIHWL
jgi:nitroreductase/ferredoxin